MPRPRKQRILYRAPRAAIYKPAGVPLDGLRRVALLQEELEALRLADLDGLTQQEAAGRMGVSRSTFQRIVTQARRQVALALAEGQGLQIEGGIFEVAAPSVPVLAITIRGRSASQDSLRPVLASGYPAPGH